jgi:hypothetical protein
VPHLLDLLGSDKNEHGSLLKTNIRSFALLDEHHQLFKLLRYALGQLLPFSLDLFHLLLPVASLSRCSHWQLYFNCVPAFTRRSRSLAALLGRSLNAFSLRIMSEQLSHISEILLKTDLNLAKILP